jgi:hypothetical protein
VAKKPAKRQSAPKIEATPEAEPLAKLGRPTKFSLEIQTKIFRALMGGSFVVPACIYGGISHTTYKQWMARGADGEEPFASFRSVIHEAIAQREVGYAAQITAEGARDWKAASWMLTHRYPARWADQSKVDHNVEVDATGLLGVVVLPPEDK